MQRGLITPPDKFGQIRTNSDKYFGQIAPLFGRFFSGIAATITPTARFPVQAARFFLTIQQPPRVRLLDDFADMDFADMEAAQAVTAGAHVPERTPGAPKTRRESGGWCTAVLLHS